LFIEHIYTKIPIQESKHIINNNLAEYNQIPVQKLTELLTQLERMRHQNYFGNNSHQYEQLDRMPMGGPHINYRIRNISFNILNTPTLQTPYEKRRTNYYFGYVADILITYNSQNAQINYNCYEV
jgi:hypothetical protein